MSTQEQNSQNFFFISGSKKDLINSNLDSSPISLNNRDSINQTEHKFLPKSKQNKQEEVGYIQTPQSISKRKLNQGSENQKLIKNDNNNIITTSVDDNSSLKKANDNKNMKQQVLDHLMLNQNVEKNDQQNIFTSNNNNQNHQKISKSQIQPIQEKNNKNNSKQNSGGKINSPQNSKKEFNNKSTTKMRLGNNRKFSVQQKKSKLAQEAFQRAKNVYRLSNIKKQMQKALNETPTRKLKNLTKDQYQILNDRSIIVKPVIEAKSLSQKIGFFFDTFDVIFSSCLCGQKRILSAQHWVNFAVNIIEFLAILITIFMYTLFIFFDHESQAFYTVFNVIMLSIFTISMWLKCTTSYYDQGKEVLNRQKIIKNYRNGIFIYDFLGYVGLVLQLVFPESSLTTKIIALLIFAKAKTMASDLEKIEEYLQLSGNQVHIWTLFNLMLQSVALCHIVGALYYYIGTLEQNYASDEFNNWIDIYGIRENSPFSKYIQCFYWALALITLIGTKGDTDVETVYAVSCLLMTVGMFAKILGQVSMVMEKMEESQKAYKSDKETMNKFFSIHNDLSPDLQGQLHNYLKYSYKGHEKKQASEAFDELSAKFPGDLKDQLQKERYKEEITKFKIINDNFNEKVIEELLPLVKEEYYTPQEIIFSGGVWEEQKLYLVIEGEIELYQETGEIDSILKVMKEGDNFGELNFFTNQVPFYSARSCNESFSTVLVIPRSQFLQILENDEEAYEKFCMVADQMLFDGHSKLVQRSCFICQSSHHNETNCGIINYKPNRDILYARLNYSVAQERNSYQNRQTVKNGQVFNVTLQTGEKYSRKQIQKKRIPKLKVLNKAKKKVLDKGELRKYLKEIQFQLERQKIYQEISSDEDYEQDQLKEEEKNRGKKMQFGEQIEFSLENSQISYYEDEDEYDDSENATQKFQLKRGQSSRKKTAKIKQQYEFDPMSRSDNRGNIVKKKNFGLNLNANNISNQKSASAKKFQNTGSATKGVLKNTKQEDNLELNHHSSQHEIKETGTSFNSGGFMFEDLQDNMEKEFEADLGQKKQFKIQSQNDLFNEDLDISNQQMQEQELGQIYQNQQQQIEDLTASTYKNNQKLYDIVKAIQINQQDMLQQQQVIKYANSNQVIQKNMQQFVQVFKDEIVNDKLKSKIDPVFQEFEAMKKFKYYFPNYNYDNVLTKIRKAQKQKLQAKNSKTPKPSLMVIEDFDRKSKKTQQNAPSLPQIISEMNTFQQF